MVSKNAFGRDEIGRFWENDLYHVDQHGKTHQGSSENLGKVKKVEK